jgi:hypothetical protein
MPRLLSTSGDTYSAVPTKEVARDCVLRAPGGRKKACRAGESWGNWLVKGGQLFAFVWGLWRGAGEEGLQDAAAQGRGGSRRAARRRTGGPSSRQRGRPPWRCQSR